MASTPDHKAGHKALRSGYPAGPVPGSRRLPVLLLLLLAACWPSSQSWAQTASVSAVNGQTCAGTRFGSDLGCTAKDFSTSLTFDQPSANALSSCLSGQDYFIDVIGQITSNSPVRYDGAYFIGESGNSPDLNDATKSCSVGVFPTSPLPFLNVDGNSCGDYQASATAALRINNVRVRCTPATGTNQLALPYTLVFENQVGLASCSAATIKPGTKSKCISSTTATVTGVVVNGYITLTKQTLPDGQPQSFSFTASSPSATPSVTSFTLSDNGSQTVQVPFGATGTAVTLTLTEDQTAGWLPNAAITCTTPSGGSAAAYVTVNNAARSITATLDPANGGALCTITNTKIPTVKVTKTTIGAAGGPFGFSATNLAGSIASITTVTAGTPAPVTPSAIEVSAIGAPVTITEAAAAGYRLTAASCTDANSARTGNINPVGTLSGNVLTIPGANIVAGADLTCNVTNTRLPRITVTTLSNGGTGSFTYTGGNGWTSQTITTAAAGTPAAGTAQFLANVSTATTITESIPAAFFLSSVTCTGLPVGGTYTPDLATGDVAFNAAALAPGADIACTFVNTFAVPALSVTKTANVSSVNARGTVIGYTITVANTGNVPVSAITVSDPLGPVACLPGGTAAVALLAVAQNTTCTLSYAVTQADLDNRGGGDNDIDNTASVSGSYKAVAVSASGSTAVPLVITPALLIDKQYVAVTPVSKGSTITYRYVVTNSGNVTMSNVHVTDVHGGSGPLPVPAGEALTDTAPFGDSTDAAPNNGSWSTLAPGDSVTFLAAYTVTQTDVDNQ